MVPPARVTSMLISIWAILIMVSLVASVLSFTQVEHALMEEARESFVRLFRVDAEANVPTWFSSSLLLVSSLLLAIILFLKKMSGDEYLVYWGVLSLVFMGLDETAILHEMLIKPTSAIVPAVGLLHNSWIIPGLVSVLIFAIYFRRFFFLLPPKTRLQFLSAAILYVGGAIFVEAISGLHHSNHAEHNLTYEAIVTVEESLEMLGIIVFIHALLTYIADLKSFEALARYWQEKQG